ncbi:PDZ domain-containing protein [Nitrospira sp. MA-1]|nr:PDZ domain-containing protein [Nitrospira sp. MA-1]
MRLYAPFNNRVSRFMLPCFVMAWLLVGLFAPGSLAYEEADEKPPTSSNPHASPPGANTPAPSGIVGLALHITAVRIGEPARLIIRAVHPSGPAARAGLNHGEEILTVDGLPLAGKTYQEAVGLIRGEVGSTVRLGLTGPKGERTVSVVRINESVLMEQTPQAM